MTTTEPPDRPVELKVRRLTSGLASGEIAAGERDAADGEYDQGGREHG